MNKDSLTEQGFKYIGKKDNGLEIYAKNDPFGEGGVIIHQVDSDGDSIGVQHFEEEMIRILYGAVKSNLLY